MRIHVLSDLHLEFCDFVPPRTDADVVVLAGDIDQGVRGIRWAQRAFGDVPVIYVIGNHEYYGEELPNLTVRLTSEADYPPVQVLECSATTLCGVRFLGCTLWTDLALYGDPYWAGAALRQAMMDFRTIRVLPEYRWFRPSDAASLHQRSVDWLESEWERSSLPTVVVSHHAPSARSLDSRFGDDPANAGFASELGPLIKRLQPVVWIHGHVHRAADYTIGSTRILCNPRGYTDERTNGFDPGLVIAV